MERIAEPTITMIKPKKKSFMPSRSPMAHTPDKGNCPQIMMPKKNGLLSVEDYCLRFRN